MAMTAIDGWSAELPEAAKCVCECLCDSEVNRGVGLRGAKGGHAVIWWAGYEA